MIANKICSKSKIDVPSGTKNVREQNLLQIDKNVIKGTKNVKIMLKVT